MRNKNKKENNTKETNNTSNLKILRVQDLMISLNLRTHDLSGKNRKKHHNFQPFVKRVFLRPRFFRKRPYNFKYDK